VELNNNLPDGYTQTDEDICLTDDADTSSIDITVLSQRDDDDDDDDEGDDEGDEDEPEPPHIPKAITAVSIDVNTAVLSYRKPIYNTVINSGNVGIYSQVWKNKDGVSIHDTPFQDGVKYSFSIVLYAKDGDYFTNSTVFKVNGMRVYGTLLSNNTEFSVSNLLSTTATCGHVYETFTVEPTCTVNGKTYEKCKYCKQELLIQTLPAPGHAYELDEDHCIEPTCTVDGKNVYICANCDDVRNEPVPAKGHHFVEDKDESVSPTCTEPGYRLFACTNEGCEETYQVPVPPTGHKYALDKEESLDPTCTEDGYKLFVCANDDCDASYQETIPKTGHRFVYDEESSQEPTCTVAGYQNYVCANEDCSASYKKPIAAKGHVFAPTILKAATDKTEGLYCQACTREDCEEQKNKQTIFPYKSIKIDKDSYTFTGNAVKPAIRIVDSIGKTIDPSNYVVVYYNNKNAGTATIHVTFSRMYKGTMTKTFKITKAGQHITTSKDTYKIKASDVKKKAKSFSLGTAAKTSVTYQSSNKNYVTVFKNGKVTVKKGTPKKTYTITITAKASSNYKEAAKKVKVLVK